MKRPTWVLTISILGIVFGGFGIFNSLGAMIMPIMMKMQSEIFQKMPNTTGQAEIFNKMYSFPDWFQGFSILTGILGVLVGGYYLFVSIRFLNLKHNAIVLFYTAIAANILCAATKCAGFIALGTMMGIMMLPGPIFGIIINVVLLIIVAISDKTAFHTLPEIAYQSENPSL